jgi:hypothetical protein
VLVADKAPLADALDDLVEPLELAWRVVDEETLEITSRSALAERVEFELYPLDKATTEAAAETMIQKLRHELGDEQFTEAGGKGQLRFDPAAKCLLAMLPQPLQRKLAVLLREIPAADAVNP